MLLIFCGLIFAMCYVLLAAFDRGPWEHIAYIMKS